MENTKHIYFVIGALIVGLGLGYFMFNYVPKNQFGAVVNYTNSGGSSNLYNAIASVAQDVANLSQTSRSITTLSSTTINFTSLLTTRGSSSSTISTSSMTTTLGNRGDFVLGDIVLVTAVSTSTGSTADLATQKNVNFHGIVTATDTIEIVADQVATSSVAFWGGGLVQLNVVVLPAAGFVAPPALQTTTSTSN